MVEALDRLNGSLQELKGGGAEPGDDLWLSQMSWNIALQVRFSLSIKL